MPWKTHTKNVHISFSNQPYIGTSVLFSCFFFFFPVPELARPNNKPCTLFGMVTSKYRMRRDSLYSFVASLLTRSKRTRFSGLTSFVRTMSCCGMYESDGIEKAWKGNHRLLIKIVGLVSRSSKERSYLGRKKTIRNNSRNWYCSCNYIL